MLITLESARLMLRPFMRADAPVVKELAGSIDVARNTLNLPHPYPLAAAESWIDSHGSLHDEHGHIHWAICLKSGGLIGSMNLAMDRAHRHALLGFWIGVPYWNQGYCTEAGRVAVDHAFQGLSLHRMHSHHFARNVASGRVLEKLGFCREGVFREHLLKDGVFEDIIYYGLLQSSHAEQGTAPAPLQ